MGPTHRSCLPSIRSRVDVARRGPAPCARLLHRRSSTLLGAVAGAPVSDRTRRARAGRHSLSVMRRPAGGPGVARGWRSVARRVIDAAAGWHGFARGRAGAIGADGAVAERRRVPPGGRGAGRGAGAGRAGGVARAAVRGAGRRAAAIRDATARRTGAGWRRGRWHQRWHDGSSGGRRHAGWHALRRCGVGAHDARALSRAATGRPAPTGWPGRGSRRRPAGGSGCGRAGPTLRRSRRPRCGCARR